MESKIEFIKRKEYYHKKLIKKAWYPNRFMDWCLDEDQKKDNKEE